MAGGRIRRVIIASPYSGGGDLAGNLDYAARCVCDSLSQGEAPIAFHMFLPQVLNDEIHEQRQLGMKAGMRWLPIADALVVYQDKGISDGMRREIVLAEALRVEVEYRELEKV